MRERERATQEILQVISECRADEMPVLESIVRAAVRLCSADLAGLSLVNATRTQLRYAAVCGPKNDIFLPGGYEFDLDGPTQVVQTVNQALTIHTPDLADHPLYRKRNPIRVKMVEEVGVRTFLSVPLIKEGVAFGCLNLNRSEVRPFSDDEIALVESFAAQAVIAIENVRQFREVQTRLEREKATSEILEIISQSRDDEMPVFEAILERAAKLCHAQAAGLQMINEAGTHLRLMCNWGGREDGPFQPGWEMALDEDNLLPQAVREARVIKVDDLKDTDRYRKGYAPRVQLVEEEGIRSWLIVPLQCDGTGIGSMTLSRLEVKPFSSDEIAYVETFAAQAVIAIENVRQFREVQERLRRESASSEVLEVISQSREDQAPVFEAILRV